MKLYHGTSVNITNGYLEPHRAFENVDYGDWIHCSIRKDIALLYAINPIRAFHKDFGNKLGIPAFSAHIAFPDNIDEIPIIQEIYHDMFNELFCNPAFIYAIEANEANLAHPWFENHYERFVIERQPIIETICISNIYDELLSLSKAGKIRIEKYDDVNKYFLEDKLSSKIESAKTTYEAEFYKCKFPQFAHKLPDQFK